MAKAKAKKKNKKRRKVADLLEVNEFDGWMLDVAPFFCRENLSEPLPVVEMAPQLSAHFEHLKKVSI